MHPHTPQDRRAFESPDWTPPTPESDRSRIENRTRYAGRAMLGSFLLLVAIVALILLL
ncbi:MAG: hypothetical protein ACR2L8_14125 [Solirubrobacteraceae bacterium]